MDPSPDTTETETETEDVESFDDQLHAAFGQIDGYTEPTDDEPVDEPAADTGGEEDDEPTPEPETEAVDEPAPTPDEFIEVAGRPYARQDIEGIVNWVSSLSPEQMVAIDEALTQRAPGQEPPAEDPRPRLDPDEVLDAKLAQYVEERFGKVEEAVGRLTEATFYQQQAEAQREEAQLAAALDEARRGVSEKFGLSDADIDALVGRTEQSGITGFLAQKYGLANPRAVFEEAMETIYWSTPEFRERSLSTTIEAAAAEAVSLAEKKARAGSLSSKGAAAPRTSTPPTPLSSDEALARMREVIAAELQES